MPSDAPPGGGRFREPPLVRLGSLLAELSRRWIPDAFVFAILLTFLVYGSGLLFTDRGAYQLVQDWYGGFWNLLQFAMQMTLILVTGYALAGSPPVRRVLEAIAGLPRSGPQAVALCAVVAGFLGWIHWGLGLVSGALLAREMGAAGLRRGISVHFPLLAAAGYIGCLVWHSGLSGSAPLLVNTPGHFLEAQIGLVPLSETIFRAFNLLFVLATLLAVPLLLMGMHPSSAASLPMAAPEHPSRQAGERLSNLPASSRAERLSHSRRLVWILVGGGLLFAGPTLAGTGLVGLDLNLVNFLFLILGLALHGSLTRYAEAAAEGARAATGVIIQFPFYGGIMGLMVEAGLVEIIAGAFVTVSTPLTFPFLVMTSAAAINLAIPSGGGQWAVQGPIVMEAARVLGTEPGRAVMAVALGDQITNMIQPFWALPLLGITGLKAGQVLGYTAAAMTAAFVIAAVALTFAP